MAVSVTVVSPLVSILHVDPFSKYLSYGIFQQFPRILVQKYYEIIENLQNILEEIHLVID